MKIQTTALFLSCLCFNVLAWAGAWDIGAFDNDDALDWVWEVTESNDLSVVSDALKDISTMSDYIEAPSGSCAVAAAEVVAALNGKPSAQLPNELAEWIAAHDLHADTKLRALAKQAIALVQDVNKSELAQLWSESGELADQWRSELAELAKRLD